MPGKVLVVDPEGRGDFAEIVRDEAVAAGLTPAYFNSSAEANGHLAEADVVVAALTEPLQDRRAANSPASLLRKAGELGIPWAAVVESKSIRQWYPSPDERHIVTPALPEELHAAFSTWFRMFDDTYVKGLDRHVGLSD